MSMFEFHTSYAGNLPQKTWLLDEKSKFLRFWDWLAIMLLVFTAIVTPYEVAFLEPKGVALFFINRVVEALFAFDVLLTFFIAVQVGPSPPRATVICPCCPSLA
ncbi:hypothetical protein CYMTET_46354 [Cymbomonas tetramitiformis]|uniref:Ion transport domain-containing protein n=1 Tax=Cymbomonas tetramitiformis TaxID=36881 RepID=A0AAE0BY43_9CHLO|nr:hypothetical protein CYMTET_46354 [Cymbomonas tetramitiformis]